MAKTKAGKHKPTTQKAKPIPKKKVTAKASKIHGRSNSKAPVKKKAPVKQKAPVKSIKRETKKPVAGKNNHRANGTGTFFTPPRDAKDSKLSPFLKKQKERLLHLRDGIVDSMLGVAKDNLRSRAEGSEASAFGMHQADAGSDAYDRDFALSLLSQEQDALYEIDEALKRVHAGTYGTCEMSAKLIPHARLEAIPFARFTVECQSQLERQHKVTRTRQPVTSLFGLTDEEGGESEEEDSATETKE
jgi:DnaK suppressor protein